MRITLLAATCAAFLAGSATAWANRPGSVKTLAELATRPVPQKGRVRVMVAESESRSPVTVQWRGRSLTLRDELGRVHFVLDGQRSEPSSLWRSLPGPRLESIAAQLVQHARASRSNRDKGLIAVFLTKMGFSVHEIEGAGLKMTVPNQYRKAGPDGQFEIPPQYYLMDFLKLNGSLVRDRPL